MGVQLQLLIRLQYEWTYKLYFVWDWVLFLKRREWSLSWRGFQLLDSVLVTHNDQVTSAIDFISNFTQFPGPIWPVGYYSSIIRVGKNFADIYHIVDWYSVGANLRCSRFNARVNVHMLTFLIVLSLGAEQSMWRLHCLFVNIA